MGKLNVRTKIQNLESRQGRWLYMLAIFLYRLVCAIYANILYLLFRPFPLKDKVVACTFSGKKFGDNPQYIFETLHTLYPEIDLVWIKDNRYHYQVPDYVRCVDCPIERVSFRRCAEYYTAKVWLDTHHIAWYLRKRKGQIFLETWHGGLGIKKIEADVPHLRKNPFRMRVYQSTARKADLFISNSDFANQIYRNALLYQGKIWKCGFPRNDLLCQHNNMTVRQSVRKYYGLEISSSIFLYAPTFRENVNMGEKLDSSPYRIDYAALKEALTVRWGGEWTILVRWHPLMAGKLSLEDAPQTENVIDATLYPDMQELIMACDIFLSDYSSGIFDAALYGVPCFTFAKDFSQYIAKDRGAYYTMEDLPFPCAKNNQELQENICSFDESDYRQKWAAFMEKTGLHETGHAAEDIARYIGDYIVYGKTNAIETDTI